MVAAGAQTTLVVCAPFVFLPILKKIGLSARLSLGVQDVSAFFGGAHTGDVSGEMAKDAGARYAIVGHSERRAMGESNALINQKIICALSAPLTPILCVGERDRDHGVWYLHEIKKQLEECLAGIPRAKISSVVIAYEPVWAIGKDAVRETTPEECREMMIYIRKVLADSHGAKIAHAVRILYGGSVDEKNGASYLSAGSADGLLPGRLSLEPKKMEKLLTTL